MKPVRKPVVAAARLCVLAVGLGLGASAWADVVEDGPGPEVVQAPAVAPAAASAPAPAPAAAPADDGAPRRRVQEFLTSLWADIADGQTIPKATARVAGSVWTAVNESGLAGPRLLPEPNLPAPDAVVDPKARLSLLQAWQAARVNDPGLRAAKAAFASAAERMPQARAQLLPQVQASATRFANRVNREGENTLTQQLNITDRYNSANDTLSLRQPVFRVQQMVGVSQAAASVREAQAILDRETQDFSVRVIAAYFEVLLAQDQVQLIELQEQFLRSALDAARKSVVAGTGTRTDADTAQARLDITRAQLMEAQQQVDLARRQLQTMVDRPFGPLATVDDQRLARFVAPTDTLEAWIQRAELNSPDVRRLQAQRDSMEMELHKARAGHLPTVDVVAQVQRSRSENTISPQSAYTNNSIGFQLNLPLYNGGVVNSITRQASAELERLDELMRGLKADLGVRVHREYRGVTEGLQRIKALQVAVASADVALDSARKSVTAGVRTPVDVLNAEQQRMQAWRDLAQARYNMLASVVKLQALVGEGDEILVFRLNQVLAP